MNALLTRAEVIAATWRQEAERIKKRSPNDSQADVLAFCADEMLTELKAVAVDDELITASEYATMHRKNAATVRRWCRLRLLEHEMKGREYMIRRGEPCPDLTAREKDVA